MTKLKDVIHFYLGSECEYLKMDVVGNEKGLRAKLIDVSIDDNAIAAECEIKMEWGPNGSQKEWTSVKYIKPILLPLSSLTEDDAIELCGVMGVTPHLIDHAIAELREALTTNGTISDKSLSETLEGWLLDPYTVFEMTRFLLSKGYDLFFMIESGQAIDKTKIEK